MAEFNCSYRKALQVYVPPEPAPTLRSERFNLTSPASLSVFPESVPEHVPYQSQDINVISYASVTRAPRCDSIIRQSQPKQPGSTNVSQSLEQRPKKKKNKKKKQSQNEGYNRDVSSESETMNSNLVDESENEIRLRNERKEKCRSSLNLKQLLAKLYALISNSQEDLKSRIIQGVSLCIEWLVSIVGEYIWDLPFKKILGKLWV
ncbi:unnamed protein product [Parnassius apollo]|uniref:(apollo) hypothetical protein n=1 Tax=Parnassius apollo TaxID=110799 RepID=A0A8S3XMV0_PARAO|nr:unnamed protein product [Parnassius apollo]